jgi:hypothetical protein
MINFGPTVAITPAVHDYVTDVIRAVGLPDFKERLIALAEESAKSIATTAALNDALTATGWAGRLGAWQRDLEKREKALRIGNANLQDRGDAISKL